MASIQFTVAMETTISMAELATMLLSEVLARILWAAVMERISCITTLPQLV